MLKTNKEIIDEVVEILANYKFNEARTQTAEIYADEIIGLVRQQARKEILKEIDKKIFGYDSSDGTRDFSSNEVLKVLRELKQSIQNQEEKKDE
jgi:hypothetical protein